MWLMSDVTPFVGAWIEIRVNRQTDSLLPVTPFVGAWIEIFVSPDLLCTMWVTPFVGAWIEIMLNLLQDWLGMYSWQLPKNKPMSVIECIERLDMDGTSIYKESMIRLIEAA